MSLGPFSFSFPPNHLPVVSHCHSVILLLLPLFLGVSWGHSSVSFVFPHCHCSHFLSWSIIHLQAGAHSGGMGVLCHLVGVLL